MCYSEQVNRVSTILRATGPLNEYLPFVGIILTAVGGILFLFYLFQEENERKRALALWYGFLLLITGLVALAASYVPVYIVP